MNDAATLLRAAAARLAAVSETARLDAELLLAHATGMERMDMLARLADLGVPPGFGALVDRRAAGEPVAHIVGTRDFWTIRLRVTPDVLIPRPDTETLLEAALVHFGPDGPARILDLGTGSGALLLAALDQWPRASGVGVDRSAAALAVARDNAARLGLAGRAELRLGDWGAGLDERFDLILANPPYVAAEALFAGADGLADYRRIAPDLPRLLAPAGFAAIEIGHDQGDSAAALFRAAGMKVAIETDLAGLERCLVATHIP